jgi:hypothetical protein
VLVIVAGAIFTRSGRKGPLPALTCWWAASSGASAFAWRHHGLARSIRARSWAAPAHALLPIPARELELGYAPMPVIGPLLKVFRLFSPTLVSWGHIFTFHP